MAYMLLLMQKIHNSLLHICKAFLLVNYKQHRDSDFLYLPYTEITAANRKLDTKENSPLRLSTMQMSSEEEQLLDVQKVEKGLLV